MAKEQLELFPTEVGYELFPQEELQQQDAGSIDVPEAQPIKDAEWCFQFFNNEPIVFAWSNEGEEPGPLSLQLEPSEGEGLNFQQNGMIFKIFPREITEKTKIQRQEQNASKNKEA
jgi:hypothetical protein